ncbi:MAG: EamA family transporter [Nocardioidaceae bacterium]
MAVTTKTRAPSRPLAIVGALGIVYVVWGSTYLAIGVMTKDMPPLWSAGARYLAAGGLMAVLLGCWRGWSHLRVSPAQLAGASVLGLLLPAAGNGLVTVSESRGTPTGIAALMVASVPLWVVAYRASSGDRPRSSTVLGVLVGFAGLAGLVLVIGIDGAIPLWPTLLIVFAAMCWSFGSWVQPRLTLPRDPFVTTVYEMLAGGVVLTAGGIGSGEHLDLASYSAGEWVAWAYLVVFGSIVAFSAYVWVLSAAPISLVATYAYVNPVVALFLGWIVLGETLSLPIFGATAVILAGVAIVVGAERSRRTSPATARTPEPTCADPPRHGR